MSVNKATEIDRHVGDRIRQRRIMLGLSQQQVADLIGVTYQQAHKYERGINRISAGRLHGIARHLGVEVGYFYEGLDGMAEPLSPASRQCLELARNFTAISDAAQRTALCDMARALASTAV